MILVDFQGWGDWRQRHLPSFDAPFWFRRRPVHLGVRAQKCHQPLGVQDASFDAPIGDIEARHRALIFVGGWV